MLDLGLEKMMVIGSVALIFIGPKDLPNALRVVGRFVGQVRGMARHFQTGVEAMIREAELEEMEKKWREENERIMKLYPPTAHYPEPGQPDEMPPIAPSETDSGEAAPRPAAELPPEKRPLP